MAKLLYYSELNFSPSLVDKLSTHFELVTLPNPSADSPEILSEIEVCFAPLGYPFDKKKLDLCPKLRVVASNTTGTPHIDLNECSSRNIYVASLRGESGFLDTITPTAEHTMGLMLGLIRNTVPAFHSVLNGSWNRWDFGAPKMLSRMSLGIVGLGRLGKMVARYAETFGMKVFYYDPYVALSERAVRMSDLNQLVSTVDVVSIHAVLNPETAGMFGRSLFSQFKKGAYLINTARGGLIDSSALLEALESKVLAGCALDVLEEKFDAGDIRDLLQHPLVEYARTHSNLLLTPHIAGSTRDAWHETQSHTVNLVLKYFGMPSR